VAIDASGRIFQFYKAGMISGKPETGGRVDSRHAQNDYATMDEAEFLMDDGQFASAYIGWNITVIIKKEMENDIHKYIPEK